MTPDPDELCDRCPYAGAAGHQLLDPEVLTPAEAGLEAKLRRQNRHHFLAFLALGVAVFLAFAGVERHSAAHTKRVDAVAACRARQASWTYARNIVVQFTQPLPEDGLTGQALTLRRQGNASKHTNREAALGPHGIGARPAC